MFSVTFPRVLLLLALTVLLGACVTSGRGAPDTAALSLAARNQLQHLNFGAAGAQTRVQIASSVAAAAPAARSAITAAPDDLDDAYNKMMTYCHATLTRFESRADTYAYWSATVAIVGALAGSVAVPALAISGANKAWTAALGGVSGAANAGQPSLNSAGLSSASQLQSRQEVLTSWKADIAPYYDSSKTLDEQKKAVEKSFADCQLYEISTPSGNSK